MAPLTLIVLGIILYLVNLRPDTHFGLRGLPWVDVPSLFVLLGGLLYVVKDVMKRRFEQQAQEKQARREALAKKFGLPAPSSPQSPPPVEGQGTADPTAASDSRPA